MSPPFKTELINTMILKYNGDSFLGKVMKNNGNSILNIKVSDMKLRRYDTGLSFIYLYTLPVYVPDETCQFKKYMKYMAHITYIKIVILKHFLVRYVSLGKFSVYA